LRSRHCNSAGDLLYCTCQRHRAPFTLRQAPLAAVLCALQAELPLPLRCRPSPEECNSAGALYRTYAQALGLPADGAAAVDDGTLAAEALRHLQCCGNCLALLHMANTAVGAVLPARFAQAAPMLGITAVATTGPAGSAVDADGGPAPGLRVPPFEEGAPGHFHCMLLGPSARLVTESQLLVVQSCELQAWRATRGIDCMSRAMERVGACLRDLQEVVDAAAAMGPAEAASDSASPPPPARGAADHQPAAAMSDEAAACDGGIGAAQPQPAPPASPRSPTRRAVPCAAGRRLGSRMRRSQLLSPQEEASGRGWLADGAEDAERGASPLGGSDELTPPVSGRDAGAPGEEGASVMWYVNTQALNSQRSSMHDSCGASQAAAYGRRAAEESGDASAAATEGKEAFPGERPAAAATGARAGLQQWLERQKREQRSLNPDEAATGGGEERAGGSLKRAGAWSAPGVLADGSVGPAATKLAYRVLAQYYPRKQWHTLPRAC
jgi:hypothetical protein